MGATRGSLVKIFVVVGTIIGALGTLTGLALTFTEYEAIILAEPADTAVHLFQILKTFWRVHERKFDSEEPGAS